MNPGPTLATERIESLDILRGFALLGILLLNIVGFGLVSAAYSNPAFDLREAGMLDWFVWGAIEISAEGAMRCLFSILFGAGVLLFTTGERGKGAWLHYRRTFWLLAFGLFDAFILLWHGDILVCYALAGALLFLMRNWRARSLFIAAGVLLLLICGFYGVIQMGLKMSKAAADEIVTAEVVSPELRAGAAPWNDFIRDFELDSDAEAAELAARRGSYVSAFEWNLGQASKMLLMVLPMFLFWDALVMMLLGMALYKAGVLQGDLPRATYGKLALAGFAVGLVVNGYEVYRSVASGFDIFAVFAQMQPTYQIGRLGMGLGYLGLILWLLKSGGTHWLRASLAAVGRMALTNYLMQSLICLFIFTGAGLSLVGDLSRASLYLVVLGVWAFQLWFSPWWLSKYRFGPVEWLWRALTYWQAPQFKR